MSGVVGVLNQASIKQGIKFAIGGGTLCIGVKALYDASRGKFYSKYDRSSTSDEVSKVNRVALACAQASFVLTAAVSPLAVWGISQVVNKLFSSASLGKIFGPNATFAENPWHPRHIVSLAAAGLAVPLVLRSIFTGASQEKEVTIRNYALFVLVTSRPALHGVNQLAQRILK